MQVCKKDLMKLVLKKKRTLDQIFDFDVSKDGKQFYKAPEFPAASDNMQQIVFIPDTTKNKIYVSDLLSFGELQNVLNCAYTAQDYINHANGDYDKACEEFNELCEV